MVESATDSVETVVVVSCSFSLHLLVIQHTELQDVIGLESLASLAVMSEHCCSSICEQFAPETSDNIV